MIINSGWHKYYGDNRKYFCYSPGLYKEAGEWFVEKGVKAVGVDQQALDHPAGDGHRATRVGAADPGGERETMSEEFGRPVKEDFPLLGAMPQPAVGQWHHGL